MRCSTWARILVLRYIAGFGLVEMAISTNPKPTINHNLYENTGPCRETLSKNQESIWRVSSTSQPSSCSAWDILWAHPSGHRQQWRLYCYWKWTATCGHCTRYFVHVNEHCGDWFMSGPTVGISLTRGYMEGRICHFIEWSTPFSITTHHTVTKAELFSWESCYTLFNNNTPHSDHFLVQNPVYARTRAKSVYTPFHVQTGG